MPRLILEARRVAATLAHGLHGRRRAGPGESFWQFRPFVAGEAASRIDWRRSGRDDRLYVREREWEAAHTVWFWVDRSASMGFGSTLAQAPKIERALVLALALGDAFVEAGERVGLLGLSRPQATRAIVERMAETLSGDTSGLDEDLPPRAPVGRFDEAVLIGDFLSPPEQVRAAVAAIAAAGSRGHLVMVVDPVEETFRSPVRPNCTTSRPACRSGSATPRPGARPTGGGSAPIATRWPRSPARRDGRSRCTAPTAASEAALRLVTLVAAARGAG